MFKYMNSRSTSLMGSRSSMARSTYYKTGRSVKFNYMRTTKSNLTCPRVGIRQGEEENRIIRSQRSN